MRNDDPYIPKYKLFEKLSEEKEALLTISDIENAKLFQSIKTDQENICKKYQQIFTILKNIINECNSRELQLPNHYVVYSHNEVKIWWKNDLILIFNSSKDDAIVWERIKYTNDFTVINSTIITDYNKLFPRHIVRLLKK